MDVNNDKSVILINSGAGDLNEELYLVAVVMRVGKILPSDSVKKSEKYNSNPCCANIANYRRPYGVGVLSLADICHFDSSVETEEKEYSLKVSLQSRKCIHM